MIVGYMGRPGSGKTYCMTSDATRHILRGRAVFANYHLRGTTFFTPDQLLDLPPGLVLLDEAHMIFSARNAIRLPPSLLMKMSQTRKSGWDLWWSAQHEKRVDSVLRDVTNIFTLCTPYGSTAGHPRFFRLRDWEPEMFRQKGKDLWARWVRYRPEIAALYDTFETVATAEHQRSKTDIYDKGATS